MRKLTIYHTNDVHSQFSKLAEIATYLKKHRISEDVLIDAGDFHDFKDIMISGTKGKAGKALLNVMGYDAICVGNNEGFSGIECLREMTKDTVPLLSVNLTYIDGSDLPFLPKSCIVQKKGLRLLMIGLTPYFNRENNDGYNAFFKLENLKVHNPIQLVRDEIIKHKNQYDLVIVLSHLGMTYDQMLAHEIDELDIIIGGHSHTLCDTPLFINECIIHQAGAYANHLGKLELVINEHKITNYNGECIEIHEEKDNDFIQLIEHELNIAKENLSFVIMSNHDLDFDPIYENSTINFICDALYTEYDCDFALMNHGIVSKVLARDVSELSLLDACPSPLNPTLIEVSGKQIVDAIKDSFNQKVCLDEGKGPGFRGLFVGSIGVSHNVRIQQTPFNMTINDELIDENSRYRIMTSDYLQRGTGYPSLAVSNEFAIFYGGYIRDVIYRNILNNDLHTSAKIKRIIKVFDNQ